MLDRKLCWFVGLVGLGWRPETHLSHCYLKTQAKVKTIQNLPWCALGAASCYHNRPGKRAPTPRKPPAPGRGSRAPVCPRTPGPIHRSSESLLGSDERLGRGRSKCWSQTETGGFSFLCSYVLEFCTWDAFAEIHGRHDTHREGHVDWQILAFRLPAGLHLRCSRTAEELHARRGKTESRRGIL